MLLATLPFDLARIALPPVRTTMIALGENHEFTNISPALLVSEDPISVSERILRWRTKVRYTIMRR